MLKHYFSILKGKKKPFFLQAKSVLAPSDYKSFSLDELFLLHKELNSKLKRGEIGERFVKPSLLDLKVEISLRLLKKCCFCERRCGIDRTQGELGFCKVSYHSRYASEFLHLGEEPELIPSHTIFFTGCTFRCVYCQNWDIAMYPQSGKEVEPSYLARIIRLRKIEGAKNVNFVGGNPDPNLHVILQIANELETSIPLIWNSNMYTSLEAMELLDGFIDLYLGDFRYGNDECAKKYSSVENYFSLVSRNFKLAYERADVILRHLVLPGHLECCTQPIMKWVSENIPQVYFNLMFQYYPSYRASLYPNLNRRLTEYEKREALKLAQRYKINIGDF
jgi:putative pyruvate formate lyase activating enzyme